MLHFLHPKPPPTISRTGPYLAFSRASFDRHWWHKYMWHDPIWQLNSVFMVCSSAADMYTLHYMGTALIQQCTIWAQLCSKYSRHYQRSKRFGQWNMRSDLPYVRGIPKSHWDASHRANHFALAIPLPKLLWPLVIPAVFRTELSLPINSPPPCQYSQCATLSSWLGACKGEKNNKIKTLLP